MSRANAMRTTMLELARDPHSELYHKGIPRRGASHRAAFWEGYLDRQPNWLARGTIGYQCWLAGKDFARECQRKVEFDWRGSPTRNCESFLPAD